MAIKISKDSPLEKFATKARAWAVCGIAFGAVCMVGSGAANVSASQRALQDAARWPRLYGDGSLSSAARDMQTLGEALVLLGGVLLVVGVVAVIAFVGARLAIAYKTTEVEKAEKVEKVEKVEKGQ